MYVLDVATGKHKQITHTAKGEYNPRWRPDGKKIGFLSAESGSMQLWEMNTDGTGRVQVSKFENGLDGFEYAPTKRNIVYVTSEAKTID